MNQRHEGGIFNVTYKSITAFGKIYIESYCDTPSLSFTEQRILAKALRTKKLSRIADACRLNPHSALVNDQRKEGGSGFFVYVPGCNGMSLVFKADYIRPATNWGSLILKVLGVIIGTIKNLAVIIFKDSKLPFKKDR
jgi:hypothetical protein